MAKARADSGQRPLSDVAYESLRQSIYSGKFRPGERMREDELAEWLGISRTPLREALSRLQGDGLLAAAPRRGLIVTELKREEVADLYSVREVLEGHAGRLAAENASSAEIEAMRELLQQQARIRKADSAALARLNRRFRDLVHLASRNRFLIAALETFETPVAVLPSLAFATSGHGATSLKDHTDLLKAIEKRDGDKAAQLSAAHMRSMARLQMLVMSGENEKRRERKERTPARR